MGTIDGKQEDGERLNKSRNEARCTNANAVHWNNACNKEGERYSEQACKERGKDALDSTKA